MNWSSYDDQIIRFENGTWTGTLGLVQRGIVDMWATGADFTMERNQDFLYTTPFAVEKYAALMRRPAGTFVINMDSLTATIDVSVYYMLFGILLIFFIVCLLNERLPHPKNRNESWHIIVSLFPSNGA